jgi:hypothetical protein
MRSPSDLEDDEADPPLWHRLACSALTCAAASVLFVLVSGVHAGGGVRDARLLVAQCWHQIGEKQATGAELHELRVGCQALESGLATPSSRSAATVVATQE